MHGSARLHFVKKMEK